MTMTEREGEARQVEPASMRPGRRVTRDALDPELAERLRSVSPVAED